MAAIQRVDPVGYTAAVIDRLAAAQAIVRREKGIIARATARREAAEQDAAKAFRELHEELRRMDVASSGNYGWEQRIVWFLTDLRAAS